LSRLSSSSGLTYGEAAAAMGEVITTWRFV
jgi:hypothetical protein